MMNFLLTTLKTLWNSRQSQRDIKGFLEFGLGYAVTLAVGFLLVRVINQSLSQAEIGKYSFIASLVGVLSPILYFSAPQAYLRFHSDHKISQSLRLFVLPLFYVAVLVLALLIWYFTRSWIAILYAALPLFTEKSYLLRCQMNITKLNILRIVELLLPLVLIITLKFLNHNINANVILCLYGMGYLSSLFFKANELSDGTIDKKKVIKYLGPTVFTAVIGILITNSAVLFTKYFFGYEAAGLVGIANKTLIFINSLYTLFLMFFPMIYMREAEKGNIKIIRQYRNFIMAVVTLACVLFTIFSKQVYWLIGAQKYCEHTGLFIGLLWVTYFNFVADMYWLYFSFEIKTWKSTLLKLFAVLILFSGIGFAPRFGLLYIVYLLLFSVVMTSMFGAVFALYMERKKFNKDYMK